MRARVSIIGPAVLVATLSLAAQPAPPSWPRFRGTDAAGIADGQHLPTKWNATTGANIRWKVAMPGLAHSSPNAANFIRGYDPATGNELWRLGGSSKITAPTPVFTEDFILVASGRRDEKPIFALRPGARGDITLGAGQTSNATVVWSKRGRGPDTFFCRARTATCSS